MYMQLRLTLVFVAAIAVAGCKAIGPGTVQRDRLDYAAAISDSWKEQALLNIVKLRYFDTPVFLDVASVISSYTLQSEINVAAQSYPFSSPGSSANTNRRLGVTGTRELKLFCTTATIAVRPATTPIAQRRSPAIERSARA